MKFRAIATAAIAIAIFAGTASVASPASAATIHHTHHSAHHRVHKAHHAKPAKPCFNTQRGHICVMPHARAKGSALYSEAMRDITPSNLPIDSRTHVQYIGTVSRNAEDGNAYWTVKSHVNSHVWHLYKITG